MGKILKFLTMSLVVLIPLPAEARVPPGLRPDDGIYDPGRRLSEPATSSLIREARSISESSGLDLLIAVVDGVDAPDPPAMAAELANRWGYHGGRALVLWVPDHPETPWISVSGLIRSEIPAAELEAIIQRAKHRAKSHASIDEGILAVVASLGEDLRFAAGKAARGTQATRTGPVRLSAKELFFLVIQQSKKIVVLAGIFIAGVLLLGFWGWKIWRAFRISLVPKTFPEVSWRPRFGAPHAGIVYTHRKRKDPTHQDHAR
jgi:hypothetical protein